MTCTNNPIRGAGASKASLFDTLGLGSVWDWLRGFLGATFFRNELYDDQNHPFLGVGRDYIAAPDIVDATNTSQVAVADIATANPDTQPPQDDPGIALYFSSYPEWGWDLNTGWSAVGTHHEIIIKALINGVTSYGRIPLWATYPSEGRGEGGTIFVDFPVAPTWNPTNPQETINTIWARMKSDWQSSHAVKNLLQQEGVVRTFLIPPPA